MTLGLQAHKPARSRFTNISPALGPVGCSSPLLVCSHRCHACFPGREHCDLQVHPFRAAGHPLCKWICTGPCPKVIFHPTQALTEPLQSMAKHGGNAGDLAGKPWSPFPVAAGMHVVQSPLVTVCIAACAWIQLDSSPRGDIPRAWWQEEGEGRPPWYCRQLTGMGQLCPGLKPDHQQLLAART